MSSVATMSGSAGSALGFFDRTAKQVITGQLRDLKEGQLQVIDASGTTTYGEPADLLVTMRVREPRFFRHAVLGGTLSVAESYLNGDWDCDDLTALFRLFVRNMNAADQIDRGVSRVAQWSHRLYHWWHANSKQGSRKNIEAHYDLGNDFFRLWLDDTMAYSSGVFGHADASLQEASIEKFDRVCRKLELTPQDHLLEIGTGWGGMALHAAGQYGCQVTTTTISQRQLEYARERVENAGLQHLIALRQDDYRDLTGQYDHLVSIEMIEAVGHRYLDDYFRQCGRLLKPTGSFVLQAIVMPERVHGTYLKCVDFIQRYVFPGGCLPSVASILGAVGRTTDFRLAHVEDMAPHYSCTLKLWRETFEQRLDVVRAQGYSERFIRLWCYYLAYCEAVFAERHVGVVQIRLDKPKCRRDPLDFESRVQAGTAARLVPAGEQF
ncbi:MAG: class I SAM-dependent methyltransferase [Planctomycetota bacterium]